MKNVNDSVTVIQKMLRKSSCCNISDMDSTPQKLRHKLTYFHAKLLEFLNDQSSVSSVLL